MHLSADLKKEGGSELRRERKNFLRVKLKKKKKKKRKKKKKSQSGENRVKVGLCLPHTVNQLMINC